MAYKLNIRSGSKDVATAGTAVRLVSASSDATKFTNILFSARGDHGIIIGDSGVDWTASSEEGAVVSDGTGASGTFQTLELSVTDGSVRGMQFADGAPYIDLYDIYVDAETNGDNIFWFGW